MTSRSMSGDVGVMFIGAGPAQLLDVPCHCGLESSTASSFSTMNPMMLYLSGATLVLHPIGFPFLSTCVLQSLTGKIRSSPIRFFNPFQFEVESPLTRQTNVVAG